MSNFSWKIKKEQKKHYTVHLKVKYLLVKNLLSDDVIFIKTS